MAGFERPIPCPEQTTRYRLILILMTQKGNLTKPAKSVNIFIPMSEIPSADQNCIHETQIPCSSLVGISIKLLNSNLYHSNYFSLNLGRH